MRYTIFGFKQIKLIEIGLTLDEALILNHFVNYAGTGRMEEYFDKKIQKTFYWVLHQKVIDDLPILNIVSTRTIGRKFDSLEEKGLIESKIIKTHSGTKTFYRTTNTVSKIMSDDGSIVDIKKLLEANNNDKKIPYKEIIDYLNQKADRGYRNVPKNQNFIRARFNEGYTFDDFKVVIDIKTSHWLNDPKMDEFLRPETLFGTKFDTYLNQKPKEKEVLEEIGKVW